MNSMTALLQADLSSQAQALAAGQATSLALTTAVLAEIGLRNPQLNAFLHIAREDALLAAAQSDARRAQGLQRGPLDGLTLAVKDNIDVAGLPTTAGMATRRGRVAAQDAFVVRQLRQAGMVLLGKLNMHEAALGATNANPHYGRCENPRRAGHTPGGSSGGSACAVAAGLCALALGTDTMGSVRVPAAYCGVVGFKGSYGRVSTGGTVACCWALDHVGPLVRSARDLALVWPVMAVFDSACPDARHHRVPAKDEQPVRYVAALDVAALGATPAVQAAYASALQALRDRGHDVTAIALASHDFGRARRAGLLMVEADLLVQHADDWREQPQNFSPELARFLRYGQAQSAAALASAQRTVAAAHVEVARWWRHGHVMLLPTTPQQAFSFDDPVPATQADFTSVANMTGVPALTLPLPMARGELPVGLQCIAPAGCDALLLGLASDLAAPGEQVA